MNLSDVLPQLKNVRKVSGGRTARCPAHEDKHNSLSISEGEDNRLLMHCHAGCSFESILAAIPHTNGNGNGPSRREVESYDYHDETGQLLFQVARFEPKDFRPRRPDGCGDWIWNLNGVDRVLYRLPDILKAKPEQTILIVEGEKDVNRLARLNLVATTNPSGAGKWRKEYNESLRGRKVCILPDNDDAGRKHALQVATSLQGIAASVKVVELPGLPDKGDVSDWLDKGGSVKALRELVNDAPGFVGPSDAEAEKIRSSTPIEFSFTPVDDLINEPQEEVNCVVEKMLPCGGFSMVCAKPKVGKSTLVRNLAVCIATGASFFGRTTKQGKVIYLCLEEKRAEVADHFRRMGANGSNIIIHSGATPKDALTALAIAIEQHAPVLVIIDPISRFIRVADFSSYGDVTMALEPLIDLARNSSCQTHVLATHHNGKAGDLREGGDAILGSTAFFGIVDSLLTMRKRERVRTIESTQRSGEDLPETIVHLDPETGLIDAAGNMDQFMLSERKKQILVSIGPDPQSEAAIKESVGGTNGGLTSKAIRELRDEGKLIRSGTGKKGDCFMYQLAGAKTETPKVEPRWSEEWRNEEIA